MRYSHFSNDRAQYQGKSAMFSTSTRSCARADERNQNPVNGDKSCEDERNRENCDYECELGPNLENCDHARELGPNTAYQPNASSSSPAPYLNPNILEEIIRQTLQVYPYMRPSLRAVSRSFRNIVDREPLPQVYVPELKNLTIFVA